MLSNLNSIFLIIAGKTIQRTLKIHPIRPHHNTFTVIEIFPSQCLITLLLKNKKPANAGRLPNLVIKTTELTRKIMRDTNLY